MAEKRYYWMKLKDDFFTSKRIKRLRNLAGGDTYTIIYLKMQLKALRDEGMLYYDGIMETFAEELALDLDENPDDVKVTVSYLLSVGLLETNKKDVYKLTYLEQLIGSETAHTLRQRAYVERQKLKKASQNDAIVTRSLRSGDVDIEKDIEKDIELESTPPIVPPKGEIDARFDRFWKVYPKKVGKIAARKAFDKARQKTGVTVETLISAVEKQKKWAQWERDNGSYIPNPATWLNQGRWEDEECEVAGATDSRRRAKGAGEYTGPDFFDDD